MLILAPPVHAAVMALLKPAVHGDRDDRQSDHRAYSKNHVDDRVLPHSGADLAQDSFDFKGQNDGPAKDGVRKERKK